MPGKKHRERPSSSPALDSLPDMQLLFLPSIWDQLPLPKGRQETGYSHVHTVMVLLFALQSPNSSPVCPILSKPVLVLAQVELTFFTVVGVELCFGFVPNTELTIQKCFCYC